MDYREFRIQIDNRQSIQVLRPPGVMMPGPLRVPMDRLRERTIKVLTHHLAAGSVNTRDELVVLGSHLFIGLLDEPVRKVFTEELDKVKQRPDTVLRLVLEFNPEARELAELPWEYLYYPDGLDGRGTGFFVAADPESRLILARHVPVYPQLEAAERPLRILVVVSQPELYPEGEPELGEVKATPVIRAIEKLDAESGGAIVATTLRQPTKRTLTEKVAELRPHVVHFLGHGKYVAEQGGSLALLDEKDTRTLSWISDDDLPDSFIPAPRLVFLHACEGAHSDSYEAFRGVALKLVYSRIPAVVAMQYQVENRVANLFALKFYESLGQGKRIDEAVQDGRRELGMYLTKDSFSSRAFGSPVVFLQNAEGIIKLPEPAPARATTGGGGGARLRCPNCNNDVTSDEQQFCYKCPAELSQFPRCGDCGQLMPIDAVRCGDCGHPRTTVPGRVEPDVIQRVAQARAVGSGYAGGVTPTLPGEDPAAEARPAEQERQPGRFRVSSNGE